MAYDAARGRVVLFGGVGGSSMGGIQNSDTWEWDGMTWAQRASSGPAPRYGHAMAYDAGRGRVVLFGGSGSSYFGDTWEWDGTTWTQRATAGPTPRAWHAMAYDAERGRVVLFGGEDGSYSPFGDTWEWDGGTWTQQVVAGPPPDAGHAMAYDAARERVVQFGDYGTWEWDGTTWMQKATSGPAPRFSHAMAYDTARGRVVLFGGLGASFYGDTWEWDGTTWTQWYSPGPSPRYGHAMAYDGVHGSVVLFGGSRYSAGDSVFGDTWQYSGCARGLVSYRDADGDGCGSSTNLISTCGDSAPPGYVADNTDCNDQNPENHPGVSDTSCNGIDENCSGTADEGYVSHATNCGVGVCSRTGLTSCVSGTLQDSCSPGPPAPNDSICNGIDDDCDGQTDEEYVSQSTLCGAGPCARHGTTSCVGGTAQDSCVPGQSSAEVCDGVDNNCDGTVDNPPVPAGLPLLLLSKPVTGSGTARLNWSAVASATGYDIVRGSLFDLRATSGDFSLATGDCLANDLSARTRSDIIIQNVWYLVRAVNCGGAGTYNSGDPGQQGSRDVEIEASGVACP